MFSLKRRGVGNRFRERLRLPAALWYSWIMFAITRQAHGKRGAFVKLVQLDSDDFAVIVRLPSEGGLHNRYIGPDLSRAEEVFDTEVGVLHESSGVR